MKKFMYIFRGGDPMNEIENPSPEQMQAYMQRWQVWMGQLAQSNQLEGGEPLENAGKVVSGTQGEMITDGPYAEGKELVGGFLIVTAATLDAAVELSKGCPVLADGGTVEVREVQDLS